MKKLLFLFVLLLSMCLLPAALAEEEAVTCTSGDYKYVLLEDGTAQITDYSGVETDLQIPSRLDAYNVTAIGNDAFYNCDFLTSITIPDSVTSIGEYAFSRCTSLTSVTIPDSVSSMGANPFGYCEKLTRIKVSPKSKHFAAIDGVLFEKSTKKLVCYPRAFTAENYEIPQGILAIGDDAFYNCDSLTGITIPDSVTSIGEYAFSYCTSLTGVTIPDSVTSIGEGVFYKCTSLTGVTIPDSVTSIGKYAFYGCKSLILTVEPDSYAESYAEEYNIEYTYPNALDWLYN